MGAPDFSPPPLPTKRISTRNVEVTVPAPLGTERIRVYGRAAGGSFGTVIYDTNISGTANLPRPEPYPTIANTVSEFKTVASNADGSTDSVIVQQDSFQAVPPPILLSWDAISTTLRVLFTLPTWNRSTAPPGGVSQPA